MRNISDAAQPSTVQIEQMGGFLMLTTTQRICLDSTLSCSGQLSSIFHRLGYEGPVLVVYTLLASRWNRQAAVYGCGYRISKRPL